MADVLRLQIPDEPPSPDEEKRSMLSYLNCFGSMVSIALCDMVRRL